jgi:MYXO-CTERM domain-containing protein
MRMVRYNHTVTLCLKSGQLAALAAGGDGPEFHVADAYQTADLLLLDGLPGYNFVPDLATAGSIDPNPMISDAGGVVNDGSVVGDGGVSDDFGSIVLMRNHASTQSGCDCDMGGTTPPSGWWVLPLFLALGTLRRRALRKDW